MKKCLLVPFLPFFTASHVNRVLNPAPAERVANIMTYNSPDTPTDPGFAQAIAEFLNLP